jgi:cation:H+ antiporter
MDYIYLVAGLVLLLAGGDLLVRGAVGLAKRAGVSALLIGLTVVAWGTSAPELVVSVKAGIDGIGGIALGNAIGSNIFNILAVMGLVALVRTLAAAPGPIWRDALVAISSGLVVLAIVAGADRLQPIHGIALVGMLVAYTILAYRQERETEHVSAITTEEIGKAAEAGTARTSLLMSLVMTAAGIAMLVYGANLLVHGAVTIARAFGVSESIIGLTLVAAGTSLPEVATSLVAAFRRQAAVAIGNVLGSNTFNSLGIVGSTALFGPLVIPSDIELIDATLGALVPLLILVPAVLFGRIGRLAGMVMVAGYAGYVLLLVHRAGLL